MLIKAKSVRTLFIMPMIMLGVASSLSASEDKTSPAQASTPFYSVLLRNFDTWDANHDGTLSPDEINRVLVDPSIKGDDAAAAASIKLLMRAKKTKLPTLTKAFFADYNHNALALKQHAPDADAVTETIDSVASASSTQPVARSGRLPVDFDLYFVASKDRIARGGADPLPGRFDLDHTRQGPLGDCFLVSSVSSFAFHDPARFAKLIVPLKTGGYDVHLPAATQPIEVPAPTDAELAISSTTAGDGVWLAIMEQAFGKYRSQLHGHSEDVEGTELIRTGGDSIPTIRALTGHNCLRLSFGKTVETRAARADMMLPKVRQELIHALADHRVITAGMLAHPLPGTATTQPSETGTPTPIPPDINVNHVYAILGYDPATDIIEIWNPHGQHFQPKGPPGLHNGYPTEHGRFKLPLAEAYQFYTSFTFEQSSNVSVTSPN